MPLRPRERWVAVASAFGVIAAALAIGVAAPPELPSAMITIPLVLGYAACSRVRFEVGAGSAAPTQLAFAPMMVLLAPALLVPAAIVGYALGSGRGNTDDGKQWWELVLIQIGGCWYAVGAAAVMAASGVDAPSLSAAGWYFAAFATQCTADLLMSVFQERLLLGATVRDLVAAMAPCWTIDCLITPVGYALPRRRRRWRSHRSSPCFRSFRSSRQSAHPATTRPRRSVPPIAERRSSSAMSWRPTTSTQAHIHAMSSLSHSQ